jgi:polyvinyl alcohol dehydrogenase (cytochrome)
LHSLPRSRQVENNFGAHESPLRAFQHWFQAVRRKKEQIMSEKFDWRRWRKTAGGGAAVCGLLMILIPAALARDEEASDGQWTMGGQNLSNWRNQDDTDINPRNVAKLKTKWVFTTGGDVTATPAVANDVVYFPDFVGNFYAVNAHTGALVWHRQIADWTGIPGDFARNDPAIHRGMLILGDEGGFIATWNGSKYINGNGARVIAADAATGALIWVTQVEKFPAAIVTSSPVIHDGVVYVGVASEEEGTATDPSYPCCTSRGSVVALDVHTGKILWQTYTAPDNGGQPGGYSGGAVWSSTPVIDPKRHSVYVGTGNNYSVPIKDELCAQNSQNGGQNCDVPGDHFDSILALDLTTGRIKWSTRGWPYDPWNVSCIAGFSPGTGNCPPGAGPDFDFGSGPNLFSRNDDDGEDDDLLGIGQKSGLYWALNPNTAKLYGKPRSAPAARSAVSSGALQPTIPAYMCRSPISLAYHMRSSLPVPWSTAARGLLSTRRQAKSFGKQALQGTARPAGHPALLRAAWRSGL